MISFCELTKPFPLMHTFGMLFADLPLKTIYYPTEVNSKGLGVVLASYTWGGDSTRLLGMPDEEIFEEMMEGMAKIHGKSFKLVLLNPNYNPLVGYLWKFLALSCSYVRAQFMRGMVKHWSLDPLDLGALAAFHAYEVCVPSL